MTSDLDYDVAGFDCGAYYVVASVVCPQIWTGSFDGYESEAVWASYIKTKASWPNIKHESDKVYLVLSVESMSNL